MKLFLIVLSVLGLQAQEVRGPVTGHLLDSAIWTLDHSTARPAPEGRVFRVDSAAQPEYLRDSDGRRTLLIRLRSEGAAAMRAHFEDVHLSPDARLFVYGLDGNGMVTKTYGPIEGSGPTQSGEFWTPGLPGSQLVIELQSETEPGTLPFAIAEAAVLDGIDETAWTIERRQPAETRVSWFRGMPVEHHVIDGYGVWEGDILIGRAEELQPYEGGKGADRQAFAISSSSARWTGGIVPYTIDPTLPNQYRITDAIAHWNNNLAGTIKLVPRTTESYYITYVRASSSGTCSSYIGKIGMAGQPVNIGDDCSTGNAIHETGHAIGLYHEHTRTDRDTYIKVNTANITSSALSNFTIPTSGMNVGAYDYGSIMHYSAYAFSANGLPTIETIPAGIAIGQRNGLSAGDIAGVKSMYATTGGGGGTTPTTVNVTINSNPTGLTLVVDGVNVVAPVTRAWTSGTTHTVSAPNTTLSTVQYSFQSWSDGGAQTHTYTTPGSNASLSANYRTRYQLKKTANDTTKGSVGSSPASADGFYDLNSTVLVNAAAFSGSCFNAWSGILNVADFKASITMNKAYDVTGLFQAGSVTFPTAVAAPQAGGTVSLSISATSGCLWKASTTASWITLQSATGTSNGVLQIKVARNNTKNSRTGTVMVNGVAVTVTQAGR
ncbi:MAG: M12 family metallopeptidase [Bryobacteraceae bacterium]